ncbi:tetratricopeptide repeat protein [uncultured Sphingomonas sp.]|uniref:tetratricopeptide repeat protein n=1 Tax=uncultured Sphingomonas sp. TaxID=158754 RepID=UPI0035CC4C17
MLNGWKAIAAYLRREERTAMRWAAARGLPVHRAPGPGRGTVYALPDEIDAWLAADRARAAATPAAPVAIIPAIPPLARLSPPRLWHSRWIASGLVVGGALLIALGALTLPRPAASGPAEPVFTDPAGKALFLQASYDWNLRTRESLTRAVREYSDAIGHDPRVPTAYVGLANSFLLLREYGSMLDADAYPRAEAAARAAVALSPQSAEAHRALAFIAFWWRQDRTEARREFARSIALRPEDALTHHWYATALLANGEAPAAVREIGIARDLDPTATAVLADRGLILYVAGRRAEGLAALHGLTREQPDAVSPHRSLAEIALFEDRADEFLRESATVARLRGDAAGLAQIARWRAAPSRAAMEAAMLRDADQEYAGWFRVAQIAALAGRGDEAKAALARACRAREPATVSAASSLWLSRALSRADIAQRCGRVASLS